MSSGEGENSNQENEHRQRMTQMERLEARPLTTPTEAPTAAPPAPQRMPLAKWQKRNQNKLRKSGMPEGALDKYFVKEEVETAESNTSSTLTSNPPGSRQGMETVAAVPIHNSSLPASLPDDDINHTAEGDEAEVSSSQGSIVYLGCFSRNVDVEEIDLEGDEEVDDVMAESGQSASVPPPGDHAAASSDTSRSADIGIATSTTCEYHDESSDDELESEAPFHNNDHIQQVHSTETTRNKRHLNEDEDDVDEDESRELRPSSPKAGRSDPVDKSEDEMLQLRGTVTPDHTTRLSSPPPQWRIVNVRGGVDMEVSSPPQGTPASSSASIQMAKRMVLNFEEKDEKKEKEVSNLLRKGWSKKAIDILTKDLHNFKLPAKLIVSQLIRQGILCEDVRVGKEVQKECMQFLELLVTTYPLAGSVETPVVTYYKGIFENVFDEGINSLYHFFDKLVKRVTTDPNTKSNSTNSLWLLNILTNMVVGQFEEYINQTNKLKPPFFQYFFESDVGRFKYVNCKDLVARFFNNDTYDEFCIYLKWTDMLIKRLSNTLYRREYACLKDDFVQHCKERDDLGLLIFLNSSNRQFCNEVCWKILDEQLDVIYVQNEIDESSSQSRVSDEEKVVYLAGIASSILIQPAAQIVSSNNLKLKTCDVVSSLTYHESVLDFNADESDHLPSLVRRDKVGNTKLHAACQKGKDIEQFVDALKNNPEEINCLDYFGNSPLHDCCRNDRGDIIKHLFQRHRTLSEPINFFIRNNAGVTPIHLAAEYCSKPQVEFLKYWMHVCGVLQNALLTPNAEGKLPFELAKTGVIRTMLKPEGYNEDRILTSNGCALNPLSKTELLNSSKAFTLKKILAWWGSNLKQ